MKLNGKPQYFKDTDAPDYNVLSILTDDEKDLAILNGENHISSNLETPLDIEKLVVSDDEKIEKISFYYEKILETLGLDLNDDSLRGTPFRVAKMYVDEIFSGLKPENRPKISAFENKFNYNDILVEKNINLNTTCEHHFRPIIGKVHVAYIPGEKVVGLSKLNRLVEYYAKRPQVQERLTKQIAHDLAKTLETDHVAVIIEAKHMCVSSRGIKDDHSTTATVEFLGQFKNEDTRNELHRLIGQNLKF